MANARCDKLTTQKPIHLTAVDLAVIGPWFPPPLAAGHRWGSANVSIISSSLRAGTGADRQAALQPARKMFARRHHTPSAEKATREASDGNRGTYGLASFYSYDPHTASGE